MEPTVDFGLRENILLNNFNLRKFLTSLALAFTIKALLNLGLRTVTQVNPWAQPLVLYTKPIQATCLS